MKADKKPRANLLEGNIPLFTCPTPEGRIIIVEM
jgi:hypothetical protein